MCPSAHVLLTMLTAGCTSCTTPTGPDVGDACDDSSLVQQNQTLILDTATSADDCRCTETDEDYDYAACSSSEG